MHRKTEVDFQMKKLLPQHDFIYERLPERWEEGIPLGNGNMGVMLWGNDRGLFGTLDKNDLWETRNKSFDDSQYNYQTLRRLIAEGRKEEVDRIFNRHPGKTFKQDHHPHVTRIPLPKVALDWGRVSTGFTARLHLYDAEMTGKLMFGKKSLAWSDYLHADLNLFLFEVEWPGSWPLPKAVVDIASLDQTINHWGETTINTIFRRWGYPLAEVETSGDRQVYYQARPGQSDYAIACETRRDRNKVRIAVAMASAWDTASPKERVKELLETGFKTSPAKLRRPHQAFWHGFWSKSFLSIPDAYLENLFYANLYFTACNEREGKVPCSLQGVWTRGDRMPPWCGCFSGNCDVQNTYYSIYAANHLESGLALYEQLFNNLPRWQERCRQFFGFEGAHCTTAFGLNGTPIYGWPIVDFWPGAGPWLAHHFWLHWLYSQDKDFLRKRAYPFMRSFMQLYLNLVEKGADGKYHLPLSHSPEYMEDLLKAWGRDTTGDHYLMRWLAAALPETVKILGIDDPDSLRWKDLLDHLVDPPQKQLPDESGLMLYEGQPLVKSHGIHAQLIGIYPLGNLTVEGSPNDRRLIKESLENIIRKGTGEYTGKSLPWMSMIAGRSGYPNIAWKMLKDYACCVRINAMHDDGDSRQFGICMSYGKGVVVPTLDGLNCAAAVMEMLLQSWGGIIRVFPSMPEFWLDACFHTLRAEGAFLVTARRVQGKTIFVEIMSEKGEKCRVKNPFEGPAALTNLQTGKTRQSRDDIIEFETRPGERYRYTPAGQLFKPAELAPWLPKRRPEQQHWFGLKKVPRF